MPNYLISKLSDGTYVIYEGRKRINSNKTYKTITEVLGALLLGDFDILEMRLMFGQAIAAEKETQACRAIFTLFKTLYRNLGENDHMEKYSALRNALLAFDPEMSVSAFLDTAKLEGILK